MQYLKNQQATKPTVRNVQMEVPGVFVPMHWCAIEGAGNQSDTADNSISLRNVKNIFGNHCCFVFVVNAA